MKVIIWRYYNMLSMDNRIKILYQLDVGSVGLSEVIERRGPIHCFQILDIGKMEIFDVIWVWDFIRYDGVKIGIKIQGITVRLNSNVGVGRCALIPCD